MIVMVKTPQQAPRVRLAQNLRKLIEARGMTVYQVAEIAKVEPKTIYNLLKATFDARMSSVEKVADVFGLSAWQLIAVDLDGSVPSERDVLALLERFTRADESGRRTILQVAEIAAQRPSEGL